MRKSLLVLLVLLAVLFALPAANAIADPAGPTLNVAIIKCIESNAPTTTTGGITVFKTDATFALPDTCALGTTPPRDCAACLRDLAHDFQCRGGSTFTSNTETVQPSVSGIASSSINK